MTKKGITKNKTNLRRAAKTLSDRLHIVPTFDGWAVKREGAARSSGVFKTRNEALSSASTLKRKSSIVIHKKDGTIERWAETS